MIGFPLPIVKPLVPSGILGPFTACLADDASPMMKLLTLLCCGDRESKPRPLWLLVRRCRGLPRPLPHVLFDAADSKPCTQTYPKVKRDAIFASRIVAKRRELTLISVAKSKLASCEAVSGASVGVSQSSKMPSNSFLFFKTDLG